MSGHPSFGWWQVLRLALVQACLGSVVVITPSTLNRIMVVELMIPALLLMRTRLVTANRTQ